MTRYIPQWLSPVVEALELTCLGSRESPWSRRRLPGGTPIIGIRKGLQGPNSQKR